MNVCIIKKTISWKGWEYSQSCRRFGGYFEEKKSNIYRRYPCGSHDARGFSTFVGS